MEMIKRIWCASVVGRAIDRLSLWMGGQWGASGVIGWFVRKEDGGEAISQSSVFYRIWCVIQGLLTRIYDALHLEKLFAGSIFTQCFLWCAPGCCSRSSGRR